MEEVKNNILADAITTAIEKSRRLRMCRNALYASFGLNVALLITVIVLLTN